MSEITLHFRVDGSPLCAVCGANLDRPVGRWWLANTWTRHREHYNYGATNFPGEYSQPCGALAVPDSKRPNAASIRPANGADDQPGAR